jgi:hypothetical protein
MVVGQSKKRKEKRRRTEKGSLDKNRKHTFVSRKASSKRWLAVLRSSKRRAGSHVIDDSVGSDDATPLPRVCSRSGSPWIQPSVETCQPEEGNGTLCE